MSDINDANNEYSSPPKNYENQVYGNQANEIIKDIRTSEIRFQVEEILKGVRTSMPGIVQKTFERDGAVWVEVQPGLSGKLRNGSEFKLPVIRAPLGKFNLAGFEIDYPDPVQGDEVAIMCADRSIQTFIKEAGVGVPQTISILNMNNAWVIPVSFSNIKRKRKGDADKFTITKGSEKVEFTASGTVINGGARKTARELDPTLIDASTDSIFIAWMAAVSSALSLTPPTTVTGKVNDGTDKLLLP
ncbi:hypothetical protein KAR91_12960 [Candidatus Pacearchaeota archaeon]|nr:hypothetical protein [Candidatus Pacearchaeota archaeon]